VALARALVLRPSVLLLDEPLGALDAKLRKALQLELKALQEQVGITFIYVTHDQEEALTMSDRLAVMRSGRVEQIGPPSEVYERPRSRYVADFLGVSNLMDVIIEGRDAAGVAHVRIGDHSVLASNGGSYDIGRASVSIRPERVRVCALDDTGENVVPGKVDRIVYAGPLVQVLVELEGSTPIQAVIANHGRHLGFVAGDTVGVSLPKDALLVLDPEPEPAPS
jgi:spermidine/putrescine transport system ATP-binding protein